MTKRVTAIALALFVLSALLLWIAGKASAQVGLPPKEADESYVIVPPGQCDGMLIEIGAWKKELSEESGHDVFWTRNPRKFVEPCETFVEKTWVARYRLAARCVRQGDHAVFSSWVRSLSATEQPWPQQCAGFQPGTPLIDPVVSGQ